MTDTVQAAVPNLAARGQVLRVALPLTLIVLLLVVGGSTAPGFLSHDNLINILRAGSLAGIVACAVTLITLSGNFFTLSSGAVAALSGMALVALLNGGTSLPVAFTLSLALGAVLNAVQAVPIMLGANPIVTTLGASTLLFGIAQMKAASAQQALIGPVGQDLITSRPLGVPMQVYLFLAVAAVLSFVVSKLSFGRRVALHGSNRRAARAAGIQSTTITLITFAVAGVAAALVGGLTVLQNRISDLAGYSAFDFEVLAAIVVGGTAMEGGKGSVWQTALGVVFISALQNWMLLQGLNAGVRLLLTGVVILVAVTINLNARRWTA